MLLLGRWVRGDPFLFSHPSPALEVSRPIVHLLGFRASPKIPTLLGQILARSLLETNFCYLRAFGPANKIPAAFCLFKALGPAIEFRFWEPSENLLRALWELLGAFWEPSGSLLGASWEPKSWPGAFWRQISAIWRPFGRLLNSPSGILGKRPFWAKSWPGAFWKPDFGTLAACRPAIKSAFRDHWETALLGQLLARSLLEANFCPLRAFAEAQRPAAGAREWKGARREQPHERRRNKRKG